MIFLRKLKNEKGEIPKEGKKAYVLAVKFIGNKYFKS